ncbi:diguanylate cyclase domain-containing protein [Rheinheimera sp.]|uniref:diguanylate cyclase domain-containing protein n=1 Tax=Rheinheimera sp. TaxID=1869214 RepID=UPI003D264F5C
MNSRWLWALFALCWPAELLFAAEKIRLQLKWQHGFQFAGYYAAEQQGYYAQAGLKVELVAATPGLKVLDEVMAGRAQFGVGTSSLLLDYAKGQQVRLLANVFQHSALVLLSRPTAADPDIQALRGQKVMLESGAEELQAYLSREGLTAQDYQLIAHRTSLPDLVNGQVAAISAYSSNEPLILQQAGIPYHQFTPRSAGIDFYGDNLFTSNKLWQKKPELVEKFRAASLRGWSYAMQHPAEVIEYMQQRYPTGSSRAMLLAEAAAMQSLLQTDLIEPGYINPERWLHIASVYQQQGLLSTVPDLDGFLYQASTPIDLTWVLIALLVLLGLLLALALLAYITQVNRRLHQLLQQKRQQQGWQHARSQILQQMLRDETAPHELLTSVLQQLQQFRSGFHPLLLLDRRGELPLLIHIDLSAAGWSDMQQRIAVFDNDCDIPGLNLLRVPQLGNPSPEFTGVAAGLLRFCAFPLQGDCSQIPGVLLVWQQPEFSTQDYELLGDVGSLIAISLERQRDREALRQSEARHRLLTDHASDVIWTMDLVGNINYVSPSVQRLRGFTAEEVMQQHLTEALTPDSAQLVWNQMIQASALVAAGKPYPEFVADLEQPHKDGGTVWSEVKTGGIYNEAGEFIGVVGVARDLTERRKAEQQMRYLAQHDSLTGLPNRALFMDRLHQALTYCSRHQRQLAVLLLDLNKFKPVNDEYGHAAGDELLKATGEALRKSLRASDTVARLGGDEFVVLLPQLESPLEVSTVAAKITAALVQPFVLSMATVQIGCSIGQALFPDDGSDADQLIRVADERMYQQKQQRHQGR